MKCPNCRAPNRPQAQFCNNCGQALSETVLAKQAMPAPVTDRKATRQGSSSGYIVLLGLLAVLVVVACAVVVRLAWDRIGTEEPAAIVETVPAEPDQPTAEPTVTTRALLPQPATIISPENADQVVELARLGKGSIEAVAYTPDGQLLVVASTLGIYLYDAETLEQARHIEAEVTPGLDVSVQMLISPDGTILALTSHHNPVRLYA